MRTLIWRPKWGDCGGQIKDIRTKVERQPPFALSVRSRGLASILWR
jgi:hypothetical protein